MAFKIKRGDTVIVLSGKWKGHQGRVTRLFPRKNRAIVEGVNLVKKHLKEIPNVREGGIEEVEAPLHVSNLMLLCPNCKKPARVGFKVVEEKGVLRKYRYCKKCGENIDLVREKQVRG